jgi:hypothetical protein
VNRPPRSGAAHSRPTIRACFLVSEEKGRPLRRSQGDLGPSHRREKRPAAAVEAPDDDAATVAERYLYALRARTLTLPPPPPSSSSP